MPGAKPITHSGSARYLTPEALAAFEAARAATPPTPKTAKRRKRAAENRFLSRQYGRWPGDPPEGKPKTIALAGKDTKASPYCLDRALRGGHRELIVVEGLFDAAYLQVRGETRAVASVAAQFSGEQLKTRMRRRIEKVFVVGDPDGGGDRGTEANVKQLLRNGIAAYVPHRLPEGMDPDEFLLNCGMEAWQQNIRIAIHGFRYVARQIIARHGQREAGDDQWNEDVIKEARVFVAEWGDDQRDALRRNFWTEIAKEIGSIVEELCPHQQRSSGEPEPWDEPLPLDTCPPAPPFPVSDLAKWFADFVFALARATQTPPDLAAMLALAQAGAAVAGKFRVSIREGWSEPTNIYSVTALLSGERKSAVFGAVMAPAYEYERELDEAMKTIIASAKAEHVLLEARVKHLSGQCAKENDANKRNQLREEIKAEARELANHVVTEEPQIVCDEVTPEKLTQLLVRQGGRMLQAGPEGTAFKFAKGRYSEQVNFDVYLKGHASDPLRSDRVSRQRESINAPALSLALAVQPDVIRGLAEEATMKTRGFLARFFYSLPNDLVGHWQTAPPAVPRRLLRHTTRTCFDCGTLPESLTITGSRVRFGCAFLRNPIMRWRDSSDG